jgi:hypothetical protein
MNDLFYKIILFALRKYREPSTWIPFVAWAGLKLHATVSPDLQNIVAGIFASIITALFLAINERKGANPCNASLPPDGTAQVVAAVDPGVKSVVVVRNATNDAPGATAVGNDAVQSGDRLVVRSTTVDASKPQPHRAGFGPYPS